MQATFYILYSVTADKYYIGHTTEPMEERLRKHNANHRGFTGKYIDWTVVYLEPHESKAAAYGRELQVKNWKSRKKIEDLLGRSQAQL